MALESLLDMLEAGTHGDAVARQKRSLGWVVDACSPSSDRYASEVAPSRSRTCSMVRPEASSSFWSAMSIP